MSIPDVLVATRSLREDEGPRVTGAPPAPAGKQRKCQKKADRFETQKLHEYVPGRLAAHVGREVKNPMTADQLQGLETTLAELQRATDVEYHVQDDKVCAKAFRSPVILPTRTSMKVYTWMLLHNLGRNDHLYMCSESGRWLLEPSMVDILKRHKHIHVLLAFDLDRKELRRRYKKANLELRIVNPWHHNRHMTIVCQGDQPRRAIYFARHLRSPIVTAVYLDSIRDVRQLMRAFKMRWDEATVLET